MEWPEFTDETLDRKKRKNEREAKHPGRNDPDAGPVHQRRHILFSLGSAGLRMGVTGGDGDEGRGERRGAESDGRDLAV